MRIAQKIGTQKSCREFLASGIRQLIASKIGCFGTIEFHNGGILWLETSFALNIREQSIMNVAFLW